MPEICTVCREDDKSIFLLGGKPGIAERAAANLIKLVPGLQIAGIQHGYYELEDEETLVKRINGSGAAVLFVGLGSPRQEQWIGTWQSSLKTPLVQGVGGSLDVLSGGVKRAPAAFRALNLEWFYRLITQPHRLGRQLALPKFVWLVTMDAFRGRLTRFLS
jgi:N-acetylglucosaminyldiphosphoundecaprenol N-acetyl-beta-D-mannosaminyltransferase